MAVRIDLNISLDGFATATDQTPDDMGEDWPRLVGAYVATRTFRERVLHDTSGQGTTGLDDAYAQAYFAEVGAEIMGAGMFGFHAFPDDGDWQGWWGDEPPFHCPVFVLTHTERPALSMQGGTTFTFLSASVEDVLERALRAAGDRDVRIGGGPATVRQYLREGLIDELHLAISPVLLGRGEPLWAGLDLRALGYRCVASVASDKATHVVLQRQGPARG